MNTIMKKKFYNCPSTEVMPVTAYGVCQPESITPEFPEPIPENPADGI